MKILLDTHVLIWAQECPEKLSKHCRDTLLSSKSQCFMHTVSSLEIARLAAHGVLEFRVALDQWIASALDALQCQTATLDHEVAIEAYRLPGAFHKDPCDRVLVAAARVHDYTLATADQRILNYSYVKTMAAD